MLTSIALVAEAAELMFETVVDSVERRKDLMIAGHDVFTVKICSNVPSLGMYAEAIIAVDANQQVIKGFTATATADQIRSGKGAITIRKIIELPTGELKLKIV